jgi:hypothetical protein
MLAMIRGRSRGDLGWLLTHSPALARFALAGSSSRTRLCARPSKADLSKSVTPRTDRNLTANPRAAPTEILQAAPRLINFFRPHRG